VRCLDASGNDALPPLEAVVDVVFPSTFLPFVTRNIVLNLQRLRIERQGLYRWNLEHRGRTLASIPLRATLFDDSRSATGPAG
jgi:hypothetical protein